ncbi:MAG: SIMPL domain-containing protein [Solirubrobacterales bacterium]
MIRRSLAIGLLALALLPASALAVERTVSVEATATVKVPNDSASFGLGVSLTRDSRGAALRAVSVKLGKVIAAVEAVPGVGDGDVKTGRVSVRKVGRDRYRASEGVGVTLHEPARAGELTQAAIAAGATGIRGPTYFVGDTEAAYATALAAAFQKAKSKASTLAAQAGASLGQALTINEGGRAEIVPFDQAKTAPESGAAAPPTKPGASTVTATVGVVFALQ